MMLKENKFPRQPEETKGVDTPRSSPRQRRSKRGVPRSPPRQNFNIAVNQSYARALKGSGAPKKGYVVRLRSSPGPGSTAAIRAGTSASARNRQPRWRRRRLSFAARSSKQPVPTLMSDLSEGEASNPRRRRWWSRWRGKSASDQEADGAIGTRGGMPLGSALWRRQMRFSSTYNSQGGVVMNQWDDEKDGIPSSTKQRAAPDEDNPPPSRLNRSARGLRLLPRFLNKKRNRPSGDGRGVKNKSSATVITKGTINNGYRRSAPRKGRTRSLQEQSRSQGLRQTPTKPERRGIVGRLRSMLWRRKSRQHGMVLNGSVDRMQLQMQDRRSDVAAPRIPGILGPDTDRALMKSYSDGNSTLTESVSDGSSTMTESVSDSDSGEGSDATSGCEGSKSSANDETANDQSGVGKDGPPSTVHLPLAGTSSRGKISSPAIPRGTRRKEEIGKEKETSAIGQKKDPPILVGWKILPNGGVKGRMYGSKDMPAGTIVRTSPLVTGTWSEVGKAGGRTVMTRSGRIYLLLEGEEVKEQGTPSDTASVEDVDDASSTGGMWNDVFSKLGFGCGDGGILLQ